MAVGIGVVGCGCIAQRAYLPGFSEPGTRNALKAMKQFDFGGARGAEVRALADIDSVKAERVAEEFGVQRVYRDWREMVESDDVEAVCVTVPNCLHREVAVGAATAGKHVLVEKPMATSVAEATQMIEAAEKHGVILMVDQIQRFFPAHEVARRIVQSGALGRIHFARSRFAHAGPEYWSPEGKWFFSKAEAGLGVLGDLGIHKIDLLRFLLGREVRLVGGMLATLEKSASVEDNAACLLQFEDGILGVVEASWTSHTEENAVWVYGDGGRLAVDMTCEASPVKVTLNHPPEEGGAVTLAGTSGRMVGADFVAEIPTRSACGGPFQYFVDCVRTGGRPFIDGREAMRSLSAALAAYASSETLTLVPV